MKSPRVLMCAPRHYAIRYEINPWMHLRNPVHQARADLQWKGLYNVLKRLGVKILTLPQRPDCPDMVFTANAGIVAGRRFIPSHFRFVERQSEQSAFLRFFKRQKYEVVDIGKGLFFEGEGDLLGFQDVLFGGFRFRSEVGAHERISHYLKKRLIALELIQPHFYHLDTCFCPVDDCSVLYYPGAFDVYGRKAIEEFVEDPITVTAADARAFACNAFRVGRTLVMNRASPPLKRALQKRGYGVIETPTSEFIKAGGSVKCLILKL